MQERIILYHLLFYLLFSIVIIGAAIREIIKSLIKIKAGCKKSKYLKFNIVTSVLLITFLSILICGTTYHSVLDLTQKDYLYEERRLTSITKKSIFNVAYDLEFDDGNYRSLSILFKKDFDIKPGKKYSYYYGRRTHMIVDIKEIN
jgi:hypothetical protein